MTDEAPSGCPNCGVTGTGRYCAGCGQDNRHGRLEPRPMFQDAVANMLGWESSAFRTLRGLVLDPAEVVSEYAAGKRRRYVPPARFCLLTLAAWLIVARGLHTDPLQMSGFQLNGGAEMSERVERVRAFLVGNLEVLLYLSLPLKALLLQLFFRGSGRNAAESLVLVLYVAGFSYLLGIVAVPLYAVGWTTTGPVRMALTLIWTIRAARSFYARAWLATAWRALLVGVLHALATAILFAAIALGWLALTRPG